MQFTIPKYIGRPPKIIGPLSFKDFLYVGIPGAILFILYYAIPFKIFILLSVIIIGGTLGIRIIKVNETPVLTVFKNFLTFIPGSKLYIWKRKAILPRIIKKEGTKPEKKEITSAPRVTESRLESLTTKIETRT